MAILLRWMLYPLELTYTRPPSLNSSRIAVQHRTRTRGKARDALRPGTSWPSKTRTARASPPRVPHHRAHAVTFLHQVIIGDIQCYRVIWVTERTVQSVESTTSLKPHLISHVIYRTAEFHRLIYCIQITLSQGPTSCLIHGMQSREINFSSDRKLAIESRDQLSTNHALDQSIGARSVVRYGATIL